MTCQKIDIVNEEDMNVEDFGDQKNNNMELKEN